MEAFLSYTIAGLFLGAAYAVAASGLVLTYTTTRVFNLAQGAISMVMAFVYWQLHIAAGLPTWLSVVLVLFVIAPLFGVVLDRIVMRGLGDAPVGVSLVVTVGVFVFLYGFAQQFWPPDEIAKHTSISYFFGYRTFSLFGVNVPYHYLITIGVSAAVAIGLYVLLNRTRIGTAMRAAVDNRELLQLFGANADRVSMLSWAVGSSLAALAGVLLAAQTNLDYLQLTFLVINSFAAAMLGRLASLPLTYVGAMALGLLFNYCQGYIDGGPLVQGFENSLPTIMLFGILIFVPQVRLRVGQVKGILAARVPSSRRSLGAAGVVAVVGLLLLPLLSTNGTTDFGLAVIYGIVMLSLVLLTGYGGYVSLSQLTFVGVGAAVVGKLGTSSPLAILAAVGISAAVGALVALPVLRLTGLYLALATLAFGQLMDKLVFQTPFLFDVGGLLRAPRVSLFGYGFDHTGVYDFLLLVVFLLVGMGVLALRRGAIGRLLIALRDSPAACGTLGLNQRVFRVAVFSASAGIAGLAGALLIGLEGSENSVRFQTLQSLPLLLLAVVAGVTTVSGALLGGVLLMLQFTLQTTDPTASGFVFLLIGVGAILLGRDPNGLVNVLFQGVRRVAPRLPLPSWAVSLAAPPATGAAPEVGDAVEYADEGQPLREPQVVGHGVA
ncbi:MAG: branched-chain amino acid ABC transporter permease [Jatrophihabitans sp.]|uniref:branched-chain amino acid ABC transporter permease n=1 Tax=Jatrophihabitans sp. TaxID=1932789 RepID=UPI003F7E8BE7